MNFKTACLASMAAVSSAVILSGCSANSVLETPIKSEGFKLDTIVSVSSYDNVDSQVIDNALIYVIHMRKCFPCITKIHYYGR